MPDLLFENEAAHLTAELEFSELSIDADLPNLGFFERLRFNSSGEVSNIGLDGLLGIMSTFRWRRDDFFSDKLVNPSGGEAQHLGQLGRGPTLSKFFEEGNGGLHIYNERPFAVLLTRISGKDEGP
jgi:hypothetical protein